MTTIVGIDPGLDGGIAILNDEREPDVHIMPTMPSGKGNGRTINLQSLFGLLLDVRKPCRVIVERQQPFPKQGGVSNFTTGYGFGAILGVLTATEMPHIVITPQTWMKALGIPRGSGKGGNVLAATRLFPTVNLKRTAKCKNLHDGMADALLIAEYGRRLT